MTVTLTTAPTLGALVGDIEPALDQAGAAGAGRARLSAIWPAVRKGALSAMREALDRADLLDLLAQGWAKALQKGLPPTVTLGTHDQDITLDPGLTITVNGVDAHKLPLTLVLGVSIDTAELKVEDGRIVEVALGKVKASGHLQCAEILTPLTLETPEFSLLGKHALKHPVPIEAG